MTNAAIEALRAELGKQAWTGQHYFDDGSVIGGDELKADTVITYDGDIDLVALANAVRPIILNEIGG